MGTLTVMSRDPLYDTFCAATPSCESTPGTISPAISRQDAQYYILGLSVLGSLIASTVSYLNPALRWQQLRGAALSIESEIWKFRCRVGPYAMNEKLSIGNYSREPERRLLQFQKDVVQQVSKTMMDTTLLSRFKFVGDLPARQLATFKH